MNLSFCCCNIAIVDQIESFFQSWSFLFNFYSDCNRYQVVETKKTWDEASLHCKSIGGELISFANKQEEDDAVARALEALDEMPNSATGDIDFDAGLVAAWGASVECFEEALLEL